MRQVAKGKTLYWPEQLGGGVRGSGGYVVRDDDPLVFGQDAVLVDAPDSAVPNAIRGPVAQDLWRRLGGTEPPKPCEFTGDSNPQPPASRLPVELDPEDLFEEGDEG